MSTIWFIHVHVLVSQGKSQQRERGFPLGTSPIFLKSHPTPPPLPLPPWTIPNPQDWPQQLLSWAPKTNFFRQQPWCMKKHVFTHWICHLIWKPLRFCQPIEEMPENKCPLTSCQIISPFLYKEAKTNLENRPVCKMLHVRCYMYFGSFPVYPGSICYWL